MKVLPIRRENSKTEYDHDVEASLLQTPKEPSASPESTGTTPTNDDVNPNTKKPAVSNTLKISLLVLLVLQCSSFSLVGRYTRSSVSKDELYDVNQLILIVECTKFFLSCMFEWYSTNGKLLASIHKHILQRPLDACKTGVPSIMYVIQNTLIYTALTNLSAPLFLSLNQFKTVTTALVSVVMLQRSYNVVQWVSLVVMVLGVITIVLDEQNSNVNEEELEIEALSEDSVYNSTEVATAISRALSVVGEEQEEEQQSTQSLIIGLCAVIGASLSSAFAGVYFELVLSPDRARKGNKSKPATDVVSNDATSKCQEKPTVSIPSLWMRNMQLAFFSILCTTFRNIITFHSNTNEESEGKPFLFGFTMWVWVSVALQAIGGLLIAAIMKYSDNVVKSLATGVSVVVTAALSLLLLDQDGAISKQYIFGTGMIIAALYCFSNSKSLCPAKKVESSQ